MQVAGGRLPPLRWMDNHIYIVFWIGCDAHIAPFDPPLPRRFAGGNTGIAKQNGSPCTQEEPEKQCYYLPKKNTEEAIKYCPA